MRNLPNDFFRYLPVSERDEQWGLYVTGGGFNVIESGAHYPRSGHPHGYALSWGKGRELSEFQAHYISHGEGEFESKQSGYRKVPGGSAFILFPGVRHRYRPVSQVGWHEYWVGFNGPYAKRLVQFRYFSPQDPVLKTGVDDQLLHAFMTMLLRLRSEPVGLQQFLAASVMEILAATLGAVRAQGTGSRMHQLVCRAKSLLESQSDATPTIEQLAKSVRLSTTHFYRVFKEHTGLSPYQYQLQLRMERAKQMLQGTAMNVKQIAAALTFGNEFHFSNAFKRKTGLSPSDWRKRFSTLKEP
jgi:AraC-like DNA-binding protein